jgi:serine/threonine protein phosphatase PrpC
MLCPVCHTPNRDNARFCKGCGLSFTPEMIMANQASTSGQNASTSQAVSPEMTPSQPPLPEYTEPNSSSDDPAIAPTQILSPQQMVALQARRWQQELERERLFTSEQSPVDIADAPTILISPQNGAEHQATDVPSLTSQEPDISEMPTTTIPPETPPSSPEPTVPDSPPEPATPTASTDLPSTPTEAAIDDTLAVSHTDNPSQEDAVPLQGGQESTVQTSSNTEAFPTLSPGTEVAGRYEITQVISEEAFEHTYQVLDHQGYQRCWNCSSEENAEGDEFCIACGAELLNASYLMHEYPPTEQHEERVLSGTIFNTFVDQGLTYIIEQPHPYQNAFPEGVRILAAAESDSGNVRRSEPNEDSILVLQLQRIHESISTPVGVYIVADGLGGHENGQVASHVTIGIIAERLTRDLLSPPLLAEKNNEEPSLPDEDALVSLLQSSVEDANTALCQQNQRDKTDMGSTITGFMIVGEHAFILNVGDSRTYILRDNNLRQLTNDHSLVGQLVAGGLIEPDDVYTHPQRSQIYRSLGDKLNVQIDIFKQQIHPGDILLSCSDGLWEMVRNPQIEEILLNAPDPQSACARLMDAANTNGGEDNVSAVVVHVR